MDCSDYRTMIVPQNAWGVNFFASDELTATGEMKRTRRVVLARGCKRRHIVSDSSGACQLNRISVYYAAGQRRDGLL